MSDDKKQLKVNVDSKLHREAKVKATQEGTTLTKIIVDALLAFIGKPARREDKPKSK